jgi:tetratricopeptide (TPR) repeat protein
MRIRARAVLAPLLVAALLNAPAASALADSSGGDDRPRRHPDYAKAARLIDQGRYAAALPLLERVLAAEPADADAHNLLGYSTRKLGRPQEALTHYREALRLNPGHRGAHEYIGEAYLELGELQRAREHLAFLNDDCWLPCSEYTHLKAAIARYESRQAR